MSLDTVVTSSHEQQDSSITYIYSNRVAWLTISLTSEHSCYSTFHCDARALNACGSGEIVAASFIRITYGKSTKVES